MTDPEFWAKAHKTPVGESRPGAVTSVTITGHLWTLHYGTHTAKAELYTVPDVGVDLRYTLDGGLRSTELFKGLNSGTKATLATLDKKEELQAKGRK